MANAKISALNEVTGSNLDDEDVLAIVNATETKKVKFNELISTAGLNKLTGTPIPSAKVAFASGAIVEASLATDSVNTAAIKNDNVTAAKLGNDIAKIQSGTSGSGDFTGQILVDTNASNKVYIWDGSSWDAVVAGTTTISGATAGLINIVSTASGTTYTISATVDDTDAANKFLAGPTGGGGAVSARTIAGSDLPNPTASAKGGVIINGNGLTHSSGTIKIDNTVSSSGSTYSVCQHDANGLVTASRAPTSADLPLATSSATGAVKPGTGLSVDGNGALTITNSVTGATKGKVTYDANGLITGGADLVASDIPALAASKITSGTLDVARIADDGITAAKLANSSTCVVQSIAQAGFPTAAFTGQLLFDSVAEDAYLWDGNAWQAITTLTKGSLVNGGTYNASTSKMASVTTAGSAAGLVVGSNLPTASATVDGVYVVVATGGTPSSPAPVVALNPPDYILGVTNASGSSWNEIDLSSTVSGQTANNIGFTPYGQLSSTNVQDVIQEVETEKLGKAGGEVTGELLIGAAGSLVFEGATANAYETTITVTDPSSADRTATFPDASGTVVLAGNAQIVNADISTSAAIAHSKLANVTDGRILVGNGSNVPTAVAVSGDVTLANNGAMTVVAGTTSAVGKVQLEDSATSTSTTKAATPAAVKVAKDAADAAATTANAALPKAGGTATGHINLDNDQELRLMEADSNGSAYIGIKGATDKGSEASYTISLPAAAPTANQVLKADASTPTNLTWAADSATDSTKMPLAGGTFTGNVNLGVDDTGVDLKLFGATAGAYILWDESADELLTGGGATVNIVKDKLKIGGTAVTTTAAELNLLDGVTSSTSELNILDGVTSTAAELNILDGVTSTAAELNILDGVTSTAAELNILDGVTATATEINLLDGKTAIGDASLGTAQTFTKTQSGTVTTQTTTTGTLTLNLNTSTNNHSINQLTGAFTLANPSAMTAGTSGFIKFTQASSPITPSWGTYWHFPTGSANADLTQTAGAVDLLVYTVVSASSIICDLVKDVKD